MLTDAPETLVRPLDSDSRPHAIVIGSGFGGLAAAVRLGARGYRVTVLERLDAPGGRAYVHRQDGFTFDAGPTIITAPFLFEELWALCGRTLSDDVELKAIDPFYDLVFADGERMSCGAAMRDEIARIAPGDLGGYDRFMRHSEEIYRVGFEQLGAAPFHDWAKMLEVAPDLLRLGGLESVYGLVSRYVRDPRIRIALSFHPLFVGGNPFSTTAVYCLISYLERRHGVHFAMGGTGALVQGLVKLIRGQGGFLRCNADVAQILVRDGAATGVRLAGGEELHADIVVSNADSAYTYGQLLPAAASKTWSKSRLASARYSMSLFVWYFGTRRQYPDAASPASRKRAARALQASLYGGRGEILKLGPETTEKFALYSLSTGHDSLMAIVGGLLQQGVPMEAIYLDLLGPAARRLGEFWSDDQASFADVTIALGRLQQVVRELSLHGPQAEGAAPDGRAALFAPAPGEQHTFGLVIIEEFFRRSGWRTWTELAGDQAEIIGAVQAHKFDLFGMTASSEDRLDQIAPMVMSIRRASRNRDISIMVGGRLFLERPELVAKIGADAMAADAKEAVLKAEATVRQLARH